MNMKHYAIIRKSNETKDAFMLRVVNEIMTFSCHVVSVEFDPYRVDFEYVDLAEWRARNVPLVQVG